MAIAIAYIVWGNLLDSPEHKLKRRFLFFFMPGTIIFIVYGSWSIIYGLLSVQVV